MIIKLNDHRPMAPVAEFTLYLDATGKPILSLTWSSKEFIEKHETVPERFRALKLLTENATEFLEECAKDFE